MDQELHELILHYNSLGLNYGEILDFLKLQHNIEISLATLKRRLREMNLGRRRSFSPLNEVISFIQNQLAVSGQLLGYRWMHTRCVRRGLVVSQRAVRLILKELDPLGVELRCRKRLRRRCYSTPGPNFIWHIDSYDKLKPYGIAINGAIDGFSRRIVWLEAGRTASDPKVVAGYYINAVKKLGGCPRTIRTDCGTENVTVAQLQRLFRENPVDESDHNFGEKSYITGTSQGNQRIESWWSMLRKHSSQYWMNLFQELKEDGLFVGSILDKSLIQFCFLDILKNELSSIRLEWNTHRINRSRNAISYYGRPIIMSNLPELYGTKNYLCSILPEIADVCTQACRFLEVPCDEDIYDLCKIIMTEQSLTAPSDPYEALDLYIVLRNELIAALA